MPLITGGGQESFHRAGTENTTAIAGFGAAAGEGERLAKRQEIRVVRDFIEQEICTICYQNDLPDPVIFGRDQDRLDNTSYFAVQGLTAETALIALDLAGFAISTGSACSSGKVKKSHVLDAMGVGDDLSACALRISLGPEHTKKDALRLCEALNEKIRQSDRRERRIAV